tara:strand:- start:316 stop:522 length:207 start_codon:yes stop_codon:yes gene_type:complete
MSKKFYAYLRQGFMEDVLRFHGRCFSQLQNKNEESIKLYGDWHVDHIKPKSKFNINVFGDEEFMKCWA